MYWKTLLGLLALYGLQHVPAPYWEDVYPGPNSHLFMFAINSPTIFLLSMGLSAFLTSYLFIEILSLFVPPLKAARLGGRPGRGQLNRIANRTGVVLLFIQAFVTMSNFRNLNPWEAEVSAIAYMVCGLSLIGGTLIAVALCRWISRQGLIEGYCGFLFVGMLVDQFQWLRAIPEPINLIPVIIIAILILGATSRLMTVRTKSANYDLPMFPQTFEVIHFAAFAVQLPVTLAALNQWDFDVTAWGQPIQLSAILLLSLTFPFLFSSAKRVRAGLAGKELSANFYEQYSTAWRGQIAVGTVVLLSCAGFTGYFQETKNAHLPFLELIPIAAIALDIYRSNMFWRGRSRADVTGIDLDNLHAVNHLLPILRQKEVPHFVMGYHFRALVYWMVPFAKMAVFVPTEHRSTVDDAIRDLQQQ